MRNTSERQKLSIQAIVIGFMSNVVLAVVKTIVGIIGNSPALLADGIMSTSDVVYNAVVWVFIRLSGKPADEEHPYGHDQLETIGALTVGAFIVTTGITVLWNSIEMVIQQLSASAEYVPSAPTALWVALFALIVKIGLTIYTNRIGKQINNFAITALAQDHQVDIYSAAAVIAGILLARLNLHWAEPLFGAVIGLLILRTGIDILRSSSNDLMDTVPGKALKNKIPEILCSIDGILNVDEYRAHRFGPYLVMNITISVDGTLSVNEGHDIAVNVEEALRANIELLMEVHVHYHPMEVE